MTKRRQTPVGFTQTYRSRRVSPGVTPLTLVATVPAVGQVAVQRDQSRVRVMLP